MKPADRADRELAVRSLHRNVVVEAGAGTGKTTLLIDRLALLLLEGGRPIERLVALTFTEKAAAEIRVRLAARLRDALEDPAVEGTGKERAAAALRSLDRAQIGTIHGFASHLLRLYPLEAGVDPAMAVDEGRQFDELFETEWARWLDVELAEESPRAEAWLEALRGADLEELAGLARCLFDPKAGEPPFAPKADSGFFEALAAEAEGLSLAHRKGDKLRKIEAALDAAALRLRDLARFLKDRRSKGPPPAGELEAAGKAPAGWSEAEFARAKALVKLAASADRASEARIEAAVSLLAPFVRRLRAAFERRGWVSFDGLLVRSRDLVRSNRRVREELKRSFDGFLIDEFQDTDPLQGELLLYLAEAPGSFAAHWSSVRLAPGRLFVVGDPKQSIYRFRGADIEAFERFTRLMVEQGAAVARLSVNFRSAPALLDAVNGAFPALMTARPGSQPPYAALAPGRPGAEGGVELLRIGGGERSVEELREREAEAISDRIESGVASKEFKLGDVAVLLRTLTPLRAYLDAFKRRGLAYVVEGEKYFYRAPEVLDFFNLLNAVDDPSRSVALLGLLRSPLVGLSDREILGLHGAGRLDYRRDAPGRAGRFYELLRELHAQVGRRPVGELVRRLLAAPYFLELAVRGYHGEQTLANLQKFGSMASEASDESGLSLKEFIRRLEGDVRGLKEEGESPLADESLDAIRVMSAHKSKGLEFPVVFLPNLCANMRNPDPERMRIDWGTGLVGLRLGDSSNAAMAALDERELGKERDEEVRVLYVAMTRAKSRLVLVGSGAPRPGSPASRLAEAGVWEGGEGFLRADVEPGEPSSRRAARAEGPELDLESVVGRSLAREERRREDERPLFVAPSAEKEPRPEEEKASGSREERGRLVGTLCHRVLETIDFKRPRPDPARARRELELERPSAGWAEAEREAADLLETFFASEAGRELASAEPLARELPFAFGEGGQVVRGAVDLLARLEGRLVVYDYKTDRVSAGEARERAGSYREQGRLYANAVEAALGERPAFRVVFLRLGTAVEL